MSLAQRAFKGFMWNHVGKIAEYALMYLFSILVARSLGPEQNGVYVTIVTLGQMILVIAALGFEEAINKFVPPLNQAGKTVQIRYLIHCAVLTRIPATLLISTIIFVFRDALGRLLGMPPNATDYIAVILAFVILKGIVNILIYLFYGQLKIKAMSVVSVVARIGELLAAAWLLHLGYGVTAVLLVLVGGALFSLIGYAVYSRMWWQGPVEALPLQPVVRFSAVVWINAIISFLLFKHFGILILNALLQDSAQVSYYDVAINVALLINYSLNIGTKGVTLAAYSEIIPRDRAKGAALFIGVVKFKIAMLMPFFLFFGMYAAQLIGIMYGKAYMPAVQLFQIIAVFSVAGSILGGGSNPEVLFALDKERWVIGLGLIDIVVNLTLYFLLIPRFGVVGAMVATYGASMLSIVMMYLVVRRYLAVKLPWKFWLKIGLASSLALTGTWLIPGNPSGWPLVVELALRLAVFMLVGLGGLWWVKPLEPDDKDMLDKINPRISETLCRFFMQPVKSSSPGAP